MIVFSPWAFGTTEPWSIWTLNIAGYGLGALWLAKCALRRWAGSAPAKPPSSQRPQRWNQALGALTTAVLAYVLSSALNARATYSPSEQHFVYHEAVTWLPHSLDAARTWAAFWQYLALAGTFWAARDWLAHRGRPWASTPEAGLPPRLRLLLWVLALNGALLSLEGVLQRLEGSGRLLFLVQPRVNPDAASQFGPWAYRGTAAAYFNLVWPLCLGAWASLGGSADPGKRRHLLLVCALAMAIAPYVSLSRGGAIVATALLAACGTVLLISPTRFSVARQTQFRRERPRLVAGLAAAPMVGLLLGGNQLLSRLGDFRRGWEIREELNQLAAPMASDYPLFGTGPGTFATVFQMYRPSPESPWPAQLHNDWLETRISFGWLGCGLIAALLATALHGHVRAARRGSDPMARLTLLAMAGLFAHARWDFPFQIHSLLFLCVLVCAFPFPPDGTLQLRRRT
jgi:O-antigen ligase